MKKGRVNCIGSSLRLKQKFGAGYTVTIGVRTDEKLLMSNKGQFLKEQKDKCERIQEFFTKNIKGINFVEFKSNLVKVQECLHPVIS